jgi:hypothetical protein
MVLPQVLTPKLRLQLLNVPRVAEVEGLLQLRRSERRADAWASFHASARSRSHAAHGVASLLARELLDRSGDLHNIGALRCTLRLTSEPRRGDGEDDTKGKRH